MMVHLQRPDILYCMSFDDLHSYFNYYVIVIPSSYGAVSAIKAFVVLCEVLRTKNLPSVVFPNMK